MRTLYSPIETNRLPLLTDWKSRGGVVDYFDGDSGSDGYHDGGGDDYFDDNDDYFY